MNMHALVEDSCSDGQGLISIDEACSRVARYVSPPRPTEQVAVAAAGSRILAEDLVARMPVPSFDQSAMDGYAVATGGTMLPSGTRLQVAGRIAAGELAIALPLGHAVRIFTGAPLPPQADAVLMQEHGARDADELVLHRMLRFGDNIRRRGEDIQSGDHLLSKGERLDARHLALLATQGRCSVTVRPRPRVCVISTGNELSSLEQPLTESCIYDSNRPMIMALAAQAGLDVVDGGSVRDDPQVISAALKNAAELCNLIVTTGGASVGDEDHTSRCVALAGGVFETLKIALKPGKPAVIGRIGSATCLGLPGNPVSALVSWLLLGGAAVSALEQRSCRRRFGYSMRAAARFARRPGRTEFAPARIVETETGQAVEILGRGGSARLMPLAHADGLVEIHALHAPVEVGEEVQFHPFRGSFPV